MAGIRLFGKLSFFRRKQPAAKVDTRGDTGRHHILDRKSVV